MYLIVSFLEEVSALALFLDFGLEGEVFILAAFFFFALVEASLATSDVGSMEMGVDCVGLYIIEDSKCMVRKAISLNSFER